MIRKDMKKALGASLKAEEQAVKHRFEKAETALGRKSTATPDSQLSDNARVIRDSFTMPALDYDLISQIKARCLRLGTVASKSEVLRAGLSALESMPDKDLMKVFKNLMRVKTGRPAAKR